MNRAINNCNKQEVGLLFLQWCLHLVFMVISVLLLAMLAKFAEKFSLLAGNLT